MIFPTHKYVDYVHLGICFRIGFVEQPFPCPVGSILAMMFVLFAIVYMFAMSTNLSRDSSDMCM